MHYAHSAGLEQQSDILRPARVARLWFKPSLILVDYSLPDCDGLTALAAEKGAVSEGGHLTRGGRRIPVEISTCANAWTSKTRKQRPRRLLIIGPVLDHAGLARFKGNSQINLCNPDSFRHRIHAHLLTETQNRL